MNHHHPIIRTIIITNSINYIAFYYITTTTFNDITIKPYFGWHWRGNLLMNYTPESTAHGVGPNPQKKMKVNGRYEG